MEAHYILCTNNFPLLAVPKFRRVNRQPITAEVRFLYQVSSYEVCVEENCTGRRSSPSTSVLACQYHPINATYLHTYLHLNTTVSEGQAGEVRKH